MDAPGDQAKEPEAKLESQPGAVVHGNVTAGRDFIGRDQVTNKTLVGKLIVSSWAWVVAFLVLALAVVLVGLASNARQLQSMLPTPLPVATSMAFAPAKKGESLIIVADFDNRSDGKYKGVEPAQYIYDQLDERAKKDGLNIRVERLHGVLNEQTAQSTGEIYSATLLLWGWYDSLSVKPVIERIRKADLAPQTSVKGLSIVDPDKVEPVITTDLPNQASYLIFLTLGLEQYARDNQTEALRYFDTILTGVVLDQIASSNRSEVYYWRGLAYSINDNPDRAIADYDQAIELEPDYARAYYNRGVAYKNKGDHDRAIADFKKCLELGTNPTLRTEVAKN